MSNNKTKSPVVVIYDGDHGGGDGNVHKQKRAKTSTTPTNQFDPSSNKLLDDMLNPLTKEEFLNNYFRKDAVLISRSRQPHHTRTDLVSKICDDYLFNLDVHQIFTETSSDNVFLWLRPTDATDKKTLNSVEIQDPDTAYALHVSGSHSAYCRAPPILEQHLVNSLLRATGLGGGHYHPPHSETVTLGGNTSLGRGEVELFISQSDGKVTGWHTDFQENFTIQISGVKRWTLRRGRVAHPLRATTPHYARDESVVENQLKVARLSCLAGNVMPDDEAPLYGFEYNDNNAYGEEQTITIYPGDVFYFPSGMWHKVETVEPGLSLNVSLMGTTYASLVCESLQHLLSQHEEWREVVTSRPGDIDGARQLQGLLSGLSQQIEEFVNKQNAAQSILPPALCYPPLGQEENDTPSIEDYASECDSEIEDDQSSRDKIQMEHASDESNNSDAPISGIFISIEDFEGPPGWSQTPPGWTSTNPTRAKLVKNTLASLISMSDITGEQQGDKKQYVLNVNFTGNEMMESYIRVVLETENAKTIEQMDRYIEFEARGKSVHSSSLDEIAVLLYYGYFSWEN